MTDPVTPAGFLGAPVRHVLSETEFDVLWSALRLGPTPVVLRLPSPGRTRGERTRTAVDGLRRLRERGLADAAGPRPELVRLLGVLAVPHRQLELRAWFGRPVRALAADRDGEGALAVRERNTVTLSARGSPAHAMCVTLPTRPPGRTSAVTLPTALLAETLEAAADPSAGCVTDPLADRSALVAGLMRGNGNRAQIAAVVHDRWGSPHRPVPHVTVVDAPDGRYRLTRSTADDATEWCTLAPVDDRGLHTLLTGLLEEAGAHLV